MENKIKKTPEDRILDLIQSACEAEEQISDDELEEHANKLRKLALLKEKVLSVPWHAGLYLDLYEVKVLAEFFKTHP